MRVELRHITKYFGKTAANANISLVLEPGVIYGILGENGAGKSTLMKIIAGYTQKSSGEIRIDGMTEEYDSPSQAAALGIGMLYQEPMDFSPLSVAENFMLGQKPEQGTSRGEYVRRLTETADRLGFSLHPQTPVHRLTVGERQQLELTRLLSMGIDLLILDEPTTGISEIQKNILFQSLKSLAREGKTIVLVSHKLGDVETLCDQVTVLRQGRVTGSISGTPSRETLVDMMFGGELSVENARVATRSEEVVLELNSVTVTGGRTGLHDCSVAIHRGEIIGLAGLEGSGQAEFLRAASGVKHPVRGKIRFQGKDMKHQGYRAFRNGGAVFLPQSRLEEGLIAGLSIAETLALVEKPGFLLNPLRMKQRADQRIQDFRIRGTSESSVESLSGGNQQRLLLSMLPDHPSVLLLENPTRGLDLDSTRWVWNFLRQYTETGTAVVFSSSELDEILTFSDRILVFFNGFIKKDVFSSQTDISDLGRIIAGTSP